MRAITELHLRAWLKDGGQDSFCVPVGQILTPAAREYLHQCKIKIVWASPAGKTAAAIPQGEKPEHMTHLRPGQLVLKTDKRIKFRGKLDSLQAEIVLSGAMIAERNDGAALNLATDLDDILRLAREIMRCDVVGEKLGDLLVLGLDEAQLREHSHHPQSFYGIQQMLLPESRLGVTYALLNKLRTMARECEISAYEAFADNLESHMYMLRMLNRISSALHIMMCKYLAGNYKA